MSDWTDTRALLQELEQLFGRDDDVRGVLDVLKMEREIDQQAAAADRDARDVIKALTTQVAAKEAEILAPSQEEHEAHLRKVSNKENLSGQIDALMRAIDSKKQNATKMTATTLSLRERANEFTISTEMADSRTAYAISLYAKISNITWDYTVPAGKLGGCVGNYARKEFRNFVVDTRPLTSFQLANTLWDIIGESIDGVRA